MQQIGLLCRKSQHSRTHTAKRRKDKTLRDTIEFPFGCGQSRQALCPAKMCQRKKSLSQRDKVCASKLGEKKTQAHKSDGPGQLMACAPLITWDFVAAAAAAAAADHPLRLLLLLLRDFLPRPLNRLSPRRHRIGAACVLPTTIFL